MLPNNNMNATVSEKEACQKKQLHFEAGQLGFPPPFQFIRDRDLEKHSLQTGSPFLL